MQNEPDMFKKLLLQAVALLVCCLVVKGVLYLFNIGVEFLWLFIPAVTLDLFGRFILRDNSFVSKVGAIAVIAMTFSVIISNEQLEIPFLPIFVPLLLLTIPPAYIRRKKSEKQ